MPHSSVISRAPHGRYSSSAGVRLPRAPSRKLRVNTSYSEMSKLTFVKSCSSSRQWFAPKRMESPKSLMERPGMVVSRSMTQMPSWVSRSIRMLFSFVSLWVTRRGSFPSRSARRATPQSSFRARKNWISADTPFARFSLSASRAARNWLKRSSVSWKWGMVS